MPTEPGLQSIPAAPGPAWADRRSRWDLVGAGRGATQVARGLIRHSQDTVATDLPDFRVRLARMEDLPALRDVFRRSSLSNEGDRASLLAHPDALEFSHRAVAEGRVRVAVIDDRVVGFATVLATGQICELEDLFVDPDWMRRGIATKLVLDALANAREQGIARIDVTANGHALAFYKKVGFAWDGISQTQFGRGHRMHVDVPPLPSTMAARAALTSTTPPS